MSRHRSWCITINNFTESDWFAIKNLFKRAAYGICGEEAGVMKLTPHLQAYVRLSSALSLVAMKKMLPRAHLIVANGTDEENKNYCSKEGKNIYEVGEMSKGQGNRSDIEEVSQKIRDGEITLEDLMFEYPRLYVKYSRSFEKMFNAVMKPRTQAPQVIWLWGAAGTGKTRFVVDKHPEHYIKDNSPWWDGYTQQEAILIDDFDNKIPFRTFLRIIDRYQYPAQVKGSYIQVNSPFIYITCEFPPEHFWPPELHENTYKQVFRRLTSVQEIK